MLLAGCTNLTQLGRATPTPPGGNSYLSLVDRLRRPGLDVELLGAASQPFFGVEGKTLRVAGAEVQFFSYPSDAAAQADAAKVSSDGQTVDGRSVKWEASPHLYHQGNVLALYLGDDPSVQKALQDAFGQQFAGAPSQVQAGPAGGPGAAVEEGPYMIAAGIVDSVSPDGKVITFQEYTEGIGKIVLTANTSFVHEDGTRAGVSDAQPGSIVQASGTAAGNGEIVAVKVIIHN